MWKGVTIDDDILAQHIAQDKRTQPKTKADCSYSFNTAEESYARNVITAMYKEHPQWQYEHFIHQHILNYFCSWSILDLRGKVQND